MDLGAASAEQFIYETKEVREPLGTSSLTGASLVNSTGLEQPAGPTGQDWLNK